MATAALKTADIGTAQLENRERIDFTALRRDRRARVLAAMEAEGLDACLFGREGNARYLTGVRRLWTAQSRPFVPTAAVVRATGAVHLLSYSASYDGMPEELQPDDIYPVTWNPASFVANAAATPGLREARRIGVDGMTPLFADLLRKALPAAELVPAEAMMRRVRRRKLPAEIDCIRTAVAVAESALLEAARLVRPGVSERALQAAFLGRMCELGTSVFAQQGTFTAIAPATVPGGGLRRLTGDGTLDEGAFVALAGGVLWAGYEGSLARTWWCGRRPPGAAARALHGRWQDAYARVLERCRPGTAGTELAAALEGFRDGAVYALGLGHEGLLAGGGLDAEAQAAQRLEADMVVAIRGFVPDPLGGYLAEEMVLVTDAGPQPLTTLGHGPLARPLDQAEDAA